MRKVDGHLVPVASRIDGTIQAVHVDDNQTVSAGQLLVELDPKDNEVALHQAKAQFDQGRRSTHCCRTERPNYADYEPIRFGHWRGGGCMPLKRL